MPAVAPTARAEPAASSSAGTGTRASQCRVAAKTVVEKPPRWHRRLLRPGRRRLHSDRAARGSGLGLSIVRAVARAHAGEATAAPVAGGGLRVTVTLPAARPATVAAQPEPAACR